jgi:peroxiredoxin
MLQSIIAAFASGTELLAKDILAETLDAICAMDAPLWRRLEAFVAKQREWKTPFLGAGERLVERLRTGDFENEAPVIGEEMPDFLLPDQNGRLRSLGEFAATGPVILSFNRGHWCPFCRIELSALADAHRDLEAIDAKIVSIMPDRQAFIGRMPERIRRHITILSDIDNEYALSLGLAIWLGDELRELMKGQGLDLNEVHGNDRWCLPLPATFVLARGGQVSARRIEPDFRTRMSIDEILATLQGTPPSSTREQGPSS